VINKEAEMKVTLFDFTGNGNLDPARYAAKMLIFTKSTRLQMSPTLLFEIGDWSAEKIIEELKLMANTNPGSWEFIHFSFLIEGVTRAFTHQLVRTRTASYAQQTMRILELKDWSYGTGPSIMQNNKLKEKYDLVMQLVGSTYDGLIKDGAYVEDARGVLPTNIHTNICMSINMRNFINMARKRASVRVQNEYRHVMDAMVIEVEKVYPWFYIFYKNDEMQARKDLQDLIWDNKKLIYEEQVEMIKKLDIIMKEL
jgi:flavin-dependent thymidylate synthase